MIAFLYQRSFIMGDPVLRPGIYLDFGSGPSWWRQFEGDTFHGAQRNSKACRLAYAIQTGGNQHASHGRVSWKVRALLDRGKIQQHEETCLVVASLESENIVGDAARD